MTSSLTPHFVSTGNDRWSRDRTQAFKAAIGELTAMANSSADVAARQAFSRQALLLEREITRFVGELREQSGHSKERDEAYENAINALRAAADTDDIHQRSALHRHIQLLVWEADLPPARARQALSSSSSESATEPARDDEESDKESNGQQLTDLREDDAGPHVTNAAPGGAEAAAARAAVRSYYELRRPLLGARAR